MNYLIDDVIIIDNKKVKLFKGAKIWLKELEELELAIENGSKSEWFYGDNDYVFEE